MTGGIGRIARARGRRSWSRRLIWGLLLAGLGSQPCAAGAACDSAAAQAAGWLVGAQNEDGSWGNDVATRPVMTTEAVEALRAYGRLDGRLEWSYYRAITWLENHAAPNLDYRARRLTALLPHGDDVSEDVAALRAALSADPAAPGWGLTKAYASAPVDTALAARALALAAPSSPGLAEAVQVLDQSEAGGWPRVVGAAPDLAGTAIVLRAFADIAPALPGAIMHGGDGRIVLEAASYSSAADLTRALAALALLRWAPGSTAIAPLLATLEASQTASGDGSLAGDPHATALFLHACASRRGLDDPALQTPVRIPDYALRRALNAALGSQSAAAAITRAQMQTLATLDLTGFEVTDLTGLEEAIHLGSLVLSLNTAPDETPLSGIGGLVVTRPSQSYPPPAALVASDGTYGDRVELSWSGSSGATYSVYRYTRQNPAPERLALGISVPNYADTAAEPGELYFYQATADAPGAPPVASAASNADAGYRRLEAPEVVVSHLMGVSGDGVTPLDDVRDLAVGADGTLYVAAVSALFSIARDGSVLDLVAAANGTLDAVSNPAGIAVDPSGSVLVSSSATNQVFEIDPSTGEAGVVIDASGDGIHALAEPTQVAFTSAGDTCVVGTSSNNVFCISEAGVIEEIIDASGDGSHALVEPRGIAIAEADTIYVSSSAAGAEGVFEITPGGTIRQVIGAAGDGSGGPLSDLRQPWGVAANDRGQVFVAGYASANIDRLDADGTITRILDPGVATPLDAVRALAADDRGSVIAAAEGSDNVYRVRRSGIFDVLLDASGDGIHALVAPAAVAVDAGGQVYVAGRSDIFRIATGAVQIADATGDGTFALDCPSAVALGQSGETYVAASGSDNVFEIAADGTTREIVSPGADGGSALVDPARLQLADDGSLFILSADRVFRRTPWGQIQAFLGPADGLGAPAAIATHGGSVWLADFAGDRVLRIDSSGQLSELLGPAGAGPEHELDGPTAIAGDSDELFVAGLLSDNVLRIASNGAVVEELVGCCTAGGPSLGAPIDLALRGRDLYVAGSSSHNVLRIDLDTRAVEEIMDVTGDGTNMLFAPNGLGFDSEGNLYVSDFDGVFRMRPSGRIAQVLDWTGDGIHPISQLTDIATSALSDDFAVTACASDNAHATIPIRRPTAVPEPPFLLGLVCLLGALAGLGKLRTKSQAKLRTHYTARPIHRGTRRRRSRRLAALLTANMLMAAGVRADGGANNHALSSYQTQISRHVAGSLLAAQHQEHEAAGPSRTALTEAIELLRKKIRPRILLPDASPIVTSGATKAALGDSERAGLDAIALDRARSRRRAKVRAAADRLRAVAGEVDSGLATLPSSRLRELGRRAARRARRLADETDTTFGLPVAERRAKTRVLYRRLERVSGQPPAMRQRSPAELADPTPTFRTITRHRGSHAAGAREGAPK